EVASKWICGSATAAPPRTELKKLSRLVLRLPSVPDLSKTLMRSLTVTTICVGPPSPVEAGGWEKAPAIPEPGNERPTVCGSSPGLKGTRTWAAGPAGGHDETGGELGF